MAVPGRKLRAPMRRGRERIHGTGRDAGANRIGVLVSKYRSGPRRPRQHLGAGRREPKSVHGVVLHLRFRYVSKAAIFRTPAPPGLTENRSPA